MNQAYLEAIHAPIEIDPAECIEDNELYAFLDEEMVKFGSLREHDLDWHKAEDAALNLLRNHCKHMRVLAHLAICLQQSRDGERYLLSIQLVNQFLESHWETSQPVTQTEARSISIKRKILNQILVRTMQSAARLDLTEGDRSLVEKLESETNKLKANTEKLGIEFDKFWKIINDFNKSLPSERLPQSVEEQNLTQPANDGDSGQPTTQQVQAATTNSRDVAIPDLQFDVANEREVKQTLFKVSTLLNTIAPQETLGFRVRRFALWFNISSLPAVRKDGTTEMMAVPADRILEYQEALKNNPDEQLLQKIEHSVAASPFWISGSYLSASVASALGFDEISQAIRTETQHFVKRLDGLLKAKFSDGTDFADDATRHWLRSGGDNTGLTQSGAGAWAEQLKSATDIARDGNLKAAFMLLEKGSDEAEQPRDQFYWRLATADFMEKTGMKSIAKMEYQSLLAGVRDISVHTWEPELIDLLKQKSDFVLSANTEITPESHKDS